MRATGGDFSEVAALYSEYYVQTACTVHFEHTYVHTVHLPFSTCSCSLTLWRFIGDLDGVLQHTDREGLGGHGAEVESEVLVHLGTWI